MNNYKGTTGPHESWELTYRNTSPEDLPWNAGMVDGDLRDLLKTLTDKPGKVYDLGCGPGHDAAFLAKEGWNVTAVDISPAALELAKKTAAQSGFERKITFLNADVLTLKNSGDAALVHDRGCFHTLPSESWGDYVRMVAGLLQKNGFLALKVFSFKEPDGARPYRFTKEELQKLFGSDFELTDLKETIFQGPREPKALFCVFRKR
jgi:cyclopropane fatty-acyl-phospholipid synthase-like methyltransferase